MRARTELDGARAMREGDGSELAGRIFVAIVCIGAASAAVATGIHGVIRPNVAIALDRKSVV